jgi:putative inorganic carbon (HCO3(-)) transporter
LALAGFVQLAVLPDFTKLDPSLGWDPHKNRLASTFMDPNFCGAYLVLTLVLIFSRILRTGDRGNQGERGLLGVLGTLVFVALILTFSRSAWLMFAVAMGVLGILKSKKLLILALVAFLAAYALVPRVQTRVAGGVDPDDSASARIVSWKATLEIVKEHPLIGVGFNAFRYAQVRQGFFGFKDPLGGRAGAGSDSSLLLVLATTGVVGLAAFILLGIGGIREIGGIRGIWIIGNTGRGLDLALVAGLAGLLVESNFINSLFYPWIMIWMWTMLGIAGSCNSEL